MRKKLILFSTTLAIVILILLVFRQGMDDLEDEQQKPALQPLPSETARQPSEAIEFLDVGPAKIGEAEKGYFTTMKDGRTVREFGFERQLSGEEPGTLVLTNPWIAFYGKDGQVVVITSTLARVPIEGDSGQIRTPKRGTLEDHVNIVVGHLDPETPHQGKQPPVPAGEDIQWRIEMEQVNFETEFSRLTSPGAVTVNSEQFKMAGRNLTMQYDQINERLQELELQYLEKFELTRTGQSSPLQPLDTAPSTKDQAQSADDKKSHHESKKKTTLYRMTLSQEVVLRQGTDTLTADEIEIIIDDHLKNRDMPGSQSKVKEESSQDPDVDQGERVQSDRTDTLSGTSIIYLAGKGPLRITIADDLPATEPGRHLLFTAYGRPVELSRQGQSMMKAMQLTYDPLIRLITMTGSSDYPVRLSMAPQQWITAEQQVKIEEETGLATLIGPGGVEYYTSDQKTSAQVDYQDQLLVKFAVSEDEHSETSQLKARWIEWLEFKGRLHARTDEGEVLADRGRLTFIRPKDNLRTAGEQKELSFKAMPLKKIELWDNIIARGEQKHFSAGQLSADFIVRDDGTSQVGYILAQRDIEFEDPNYLIQAREKLELVFSDQSRLPDDGRKSKFAAARSNSNIGFDQLFSSSRPNRVLAAGRGGGVALWEKQRDLHVVGDRIEGNAITDIWTIFGNPAKIDLAQEGNLLGPSIHLDRAKQLCEVIGSGRILANTDSDLVGGQLDSSAPMTIQWTDRATYHFAGNQIQFDGVTARIEQRQKEKSRVSLLTSPKLMVWLTESSRKDEKSEELMGARDLQRLSAFGPLGSDVQVKTFERTVSGDILTESTLKAQRLEYNQNEKEMSAYGGGWTELVNYQQTGQTAEADKKDSLNRKMENLFGSEQPSYTLIRFGDQMRYRPEDATLLFNGGVALDHLPITQSILSTDRVLQNSEGLRRLDCRELLIAHEMLALKSQKPDQSQQELVAAAAGDVDDMPTLSQSKQTSTAMGNIFFEAVVNGRHHTFSGETWIYESPDNVVTITGSETMPVYLDQMAFLRIRCRFDELGVRLFDALPYGQGEIPLAAY